jgi:hypothetical protein
MIAAWRLAILCFPAPPLFGADGAIFIARGMRAPARHAGEEDDG